MLACERQMSSIVRPTAYKPAMLASDQIASQLKEHLMIPTTLAARQQYLNNVFSVQHGQCYTLFTHHNAVTAADHT